MSVPSYYVAETLATVEIRRQKIESANYIGVLENPPLCPVSQFVTVPNMKQPSHASFNPLPIG